MCSLEVDGELPYHRVLYQEALQVYYGAILCFTSEIIKQRDQHLMAKLGSLGRSIAVILTICPILVLNA